MQYKQNECDFLIYLSVYLLTNDAKVIKLKPLGVNTQPQPVCNKTKQKKYSIDLSKIGNLSIARVKRCVHKIF